MPTKGRHASGALTVLKYIGRLLWKLLPKRRTVLRAMLCAFIAALPFLLLLGIHRPLIMLPTIAAFSVVVWKTGLNHDFMRQIKWMRRMSARGPLVWGYIRAERLTIKASRKAFGDKLHAPPLTPAKIHASTSLASAVVLKWKPQVTSKFSTETFELQMALLPHAEASEGEAEAAPAWAAVADQLTEPQFSAGGLTPDTGYAMRVRAVNSKGRSEWCAGSFKTKQEAVDNGGSGPGYVWSQSTTANCDLLVKVDVPPGTRGRQLKVGVKKTLLEVSLAGQTILAGDFFNAVLADDMEWELVDGRELQITLLKDLSGTATPVYIWPCLLKGHPQVDISRIKRKAGEGGFGGEGLDSASAAQLAQMLGNMGPEDG